MIADYFRIAALNLLHRKLRSWLTVLGILIGIVAIVSLLSLSQGMKKAVADEFAAFGADKIIVSPALVGGVPGAESSAKLRDGDVKQVERVRGVGSVNRGIYRVGKTNFNRKVKFPFISGIDFEMGTDINDDFGFLDVVEGRTLKKSDRSAVLAGYKIRYNNVFGKPVRVGQSVEIEGQTFHVVGTLAQTGDPGYDGGFAMTLPAVADLFNLDDEYDIIYAKVNPGEDVGQVAERMKRSLRNFRDVEERKEDFTVETSEEVQASLFVILDIISAVLIAIAGISLLVGAINIMNTMYTSILERTNEIGVMKAVGAQNKDILFLFTLESGLLGLVGGGLGVLIGMGISKVVEIVATASLGIELVKAYFPPSLILGSLLFAFLLGAGSGLLPAWQAARMQPVESLRY